MYYSIITFTARAESLNQSQTLFILAPSGLYKGGSCWLFCPALWSHLRSFLVCRLWLETVVCVNRKAAVRNPLDINIFKKEKWKHFFLKFFLSKLNFVTQQPAIQEMCPKRHIPIYSLRDSQETRDIRSYRQQLWR